MSPNGTEPLRRVLVGLPSRPRPVERGHAAGRRHVVADDGGEISRKGDGGPTCLTRPLARGGGA